MEPDRSPHREPPGRLATWRDTLATLTVTALAYAIAAGLDLHERLVGLLGRHEYAQLDELLLAAVAGIACATWLARRRWRDLSAALRARDRVAEALRVSEARFAVAVLGSNDGIWDWDLLTQDFYFSPRWKEMLGLPDAITGAAWMPLLHPDDLPMLTASFEPIIGGHSDHFECEHRLRHADGGYRWMLTRGICLRDPSGRPIRLAGSLADVTERVESMHALRESEERFRALVEHAADGIVVHDMLGIITDVNPAVCASLGYAREELVGHPITMVDQVTNPEIILQTVSALHEGREVHLETTHRRKDGRVLPVEIHLVPFTWRTQMLVLGTVRDVTQRREAERALRDSENRHRVLFESLEAAVFVLDGGRCVDCNPAGLRLLRRSSRDEVLGRRLEDFSPPRQPDGTESARTLNARLAEAATGSTVFEWQGVRPDGETFLAELRLAPFTVGPAALVQAIALNITRRKRDEEILRSTQAQLQVVIEHGSVGFWEWDLHANETTYFDSWRRQFGYDVEAFAGTWSDWVGILHPDDHWQVAASFEGALRSADHYQTEFRLRHGDGSYRWVLSRAVFLRDPQGEPRSLLGVHIDISERKRLEEELQGLNRQLGARVAERTGELSAAVDQLHLQSTALESVADAIAIVDRRGRFLWVNSAFTQLTGYTADEVRGRTPALLKSDAHDPAFYRGLVATIRAGETYRAEIVNRRRDDSTYPADLLISPVRDADGSVTHFVVVQRDITDRKRADDALRHFSAELEHRVAERTAQLESANRELESFSYSVSHDLRAPLRAVDGFSRMLEDDYADRFDAEGIRLLQRIRGGAHRMGQLIDDLLRLSRLQRGQLHRDRIDLSALVHASAAELRRAAPQRVVELVVADGIVVEGDRQLLTVALHNLLDNAWKYTSKRATARIEFGATAGEDEPVYFVRDDGAGFDMRYVGKLFGAFQRLHGVEEFEGTGIGLASVQRIIARHGGRVWAEAAVDCGATFFFTLPRATRVGAGRARRPRGGRSDTATGAG